MQKGIQAQCAHAGTPVFAGGGPLFGFARCRFGMRCATGYLCADGVSVTVQVMPMASLTPSGTRSR
ncbi:hypothetical protein C7402_14723 [Paraburkholderia unamae]|uniref:Uncharacterized protein n=1 Tax=Paraburkholderia unamae TaxID=219649 RepID=A0ABX5KA10_9BURK|nr:hypothetical protein C7402_14723 [Paraburkholderia unamae]